MRLHLGGHLSWYAQKKSWVDVPLTQPARLTDVLENLGVPINEVAVGTLNGASLFEFTGVIVNDEDTVELYPPVGGG
jgi:sulfur carrier protein ThiS